MTANFLLDVWLELTYTDSNDDETKMQYLSRNCKGEITLFIILSGFEVR